MGNKAEAQKVEEQEEMSAGGKNQIMIDIKTLNSVLRRLNEMARSYTPIGSKERAEALFLESEINFFINKIKVSETRLDELEKLVKPYKPIRAKNGNDICAS